MTRYQLLLLPFLAGAILVLGGALNQKPAQANPIVLAGPNQTGDPEANEILDRALAALAPERLRWMECKVWQQGKYEDFSYQACGRLLTAPGDRSRFDLNAKVGRTVGELRLVCDGKILSQSLRLGGDKAAVTLQELPAGKEVIKTSCELAQSRARFLQDNGAGGLEPLVRSFRRQMHGARFVQHRWNGRDVYVIAGSPLEETGASTPAAAFAPPRFQLRQGVLFLDAQTWWPHRVEWWGAERPNQPIQLLLQTEYRNPVVNQPLSAERCAAEFAVSLN